MEKYINSTSFFHEKFRKIIDKPIKTLKTNTDTRFMSNFQTTVSLAYKMSCQYYNDFFHCINWNSFLENVPAFKRRCLFAQYTCDK